MTTVTTTDRSDDTPRNTSSGRRTRSVRTIIGASVAAVVAFAPMSGVVDAAPSALLQQEGDNTDRSETAAAPPVELGDRNELAAWWQDRLNEWLQLSGSELYPIVVDGWYGPNTQQATIAFQEATASVEADGVVNPQDRVALREAIDALVGETGDGTDDGAVGFDTDIATSSNFPLIGAPALLEDVVFGGEAGGDRLIFEFEQDEGALSYEIQYVDSVVDASGEPVDVGDGPILQITMLPASGVDRSGNDAEVVYTGPERIDTTDALTHVDELVSVLDFEATMVWAAAFTDREGPLLRRPVPFRAQVMENPLRLVVDVRSG